jgi:hypothetical protein
MKSIDPNSSHTSTEGRASTIGEAQAEICRPRLLRAGNSAPIGYAERRIRGNKASVGRRV